MGREKPGLEVAADIFTALGMGSAAVCAGVIIGNYGVPPEIFERWHSTIGWLVLIMGISSIINVILRKRIKASGRKTKETTTTRETPR